MLIHLSCWSRFSACDLIESERECRRLCVGFMKTREYGELCTQQHGLMHMHCAFMYARSYTNISISPCGWGKKLKEKKTLPIKAVELHLISTTGIPNTTHLQLCARLCASVNNGNSMYRWKKQRMFPYSFICFVEDNGSCGWRQYQMEICNE